MVLQYIHPKATKMIGTDKPPIYNNFKLETKSMGLSTKNYLALNSRQKKYIKTKQCNARKRDSMEFYLINNLLKSILIRENKTNLLNITEIEIQAYHQQENITFYIQRPFYQHSIKNIYESSHKIKKDETPYLIPQLLHLFTNNTNFILPLIVPNNILVETAWDGTKTLVLNQTSMASYQLLISQESILLAKFKQIYCYIHPDSFDQKRKAPNISFKTQLYSFGLNLFSLLFNKQVFLPLNARRDQVTFDIFEGMEKIRKSFQSLRKEFQSQVVKHQIHQKQEQIGNNKLWGFFEDVFVSQECPIKNWTQVIDIFQPGYFDYFIHNTSVRTFRAMKQIYDFEDQQTKQHYHKMGVISLDCSVESHKKQLILFYLTKYQEFDELKFKLYGKGNIYYPKLFLSYKKIEQQAERLRVDKFYQSLEREQNYDFRAEVEESMKFNITSFEIECSKIKEFVRAENKEHISDSAEEELKEEPQKKEDFFFGSNRTIYVANELHTSLLAYESQLWL